MTSSARVVVVGAGGRLGRTAVEVVLETEGLELAARLDRGDDVRAALREVGADVGLEATVAGRGALHARWMLEAGLAPVVGTSGVTEDERSELDALARAAELPALVVPNFSLGILLLERALREIAPHFPDVSLVERHHATKRDAPSATAQALARALRGGEHEVPIRSVRRPGHYAHHEVRLAGGGEALTLRHDMTGPDAFRPGLARALRGVLGLPPGLHVGLGSLVEAGVGPERRGEARP